MVWCGFWSRGTAGDRGSIGAPVAAFLRRAGWEVAGFDLAGGADVLDLPALRRAARGCAAIVHLAALAHDSAGSPEQITAVKGDERTPQPPADAQQIRDLVVVNSFGQHLS